jgi:hypothetical protein
MDGQRSSFTAELEALTARFGNKDSFEAANAFLDLHLRWATAVAVSEPQKAIEQYLLAEDCQRTIGTFATGSGEGLASMSALYEIMGKRADLEEKLAALSHNHDDAKEHLQHALAIWTQIQSDPNGLGDDTPARSSIQRLQSKIAGAQQ